jgi:beta-phosphoglucomutase
MPAVIFDLDGTLMDSYDAHFESWCHLAGELGHELTEAQFQQQFGRKNEPILAELHEWTGAALPDDAEIERLAQRKEARYREIIGKDFPVMRGAAELIAMLKDRHWQVAIGSSTPRVNLEFTQARLAKRGVHFDAVACGCDVTRSKPEPDVFLLAAERLGMRPRDCVVIEDAPAGIEAAHRAGMASVGLASKGRTREELAQALCVVDCLTELGVDVLDGLTRAKA